MSQVITIRVSQWYLVFLFTLFGFALSVKNARGTPTTTDGIVLVLVCTAVAFVWGWIVARVMCLPTRTSTTLGVSVDPSTRPEQGIDR